MYAVTSELSAPPLQGIPVRRTISGHEGTHRALRRWGNGNDKTTLNVWIFKARLYENGNMRYALSDVLFVWDKWATPGHFRCHKREHDNFYFESDPKEVRFIDLKCKTFSFSAFLPYLVRWLCSSLDWTSILLPPLLPFGGRRELGAYYVSSLGPEADVLDNGCSLWGPFTLTFIHLFMSSGDGRKPDRIDNNLA